MLKLYQTDGPRSPGPDPAVLRAQGWAVAAVVGEYCVAWRGAEEVVLVWRDGGWQPVATRPAARAA
jgi:hypothetical protein